LLGIHQRKVNSMRDAMEHAGRGDRHQRARATCVVVSVQGTPSRIALAIIHCIVVMMMTVIVMVVVTMMVASIMMMMTVIAGSMAVIARRVCVDENV
jgi:hypothetical protein